MRNKIPNTPFATRLSGSAKETQLRIRSMFQWKKKRPPVWLFAFIVVVIFGCIGLVSCREKEDVLCMGLNARVVEIDTEQMILYIQDIDEDAAVFGQRCALDCKQAAEEKKLIFVDYQTSELTDIPFAEFQVGDELVISMLTSQKEGAKDASALAEQVQLGTQRPLYVTLTQNATWYSEFVENISSDFEREDYDGVRRFDSDDRTLIYEDGPENVVESLVAFQYYCQTLLKFDKLNDHIGSDGLKRSVENERKQAAEGVYFEKVTIHEFDTLTKEDFEPGGKYVSDSKQSFEFVDQVNYFKDIYGLTEYAVVYVDLSWQWSEKALSMGPQLDNGRYERLYLVGKTSEDAAWKIYECFWGEQVLGRTFSDQESMDALLMSELFTASNVSEVALEPTGKLLVAPAAEGQSFTAAYFTERNNYELVIAVWDADTQSIVGAPFRAANSGGIPRVVSFAWEGEQRLLYTANGMSQGFSHGQAGMICLSDGKMNWKWPVEGDVREQSRNLSGQPYTEYLAYWENHLALMCPNGVEIFAENPNYGPHEGSPRQWEFEQEAYFYIREQNVVNSDLTQARIWLEDFCQNENNPWQARNSSACWRILDLRRGEDKMCTLLCVDEHSDAKYLRAELKIDHFSQEPPEMIDWAIGTADILNQEDLDALNDVPHIKTTIQEVIHPDEVDIRFTPEGKPILAYFFETVYHANRAYFLGEEPGAPREGDRRIDSVRFLGSEVTHETTGEAYLVRTSIYNTRMESADSQPVTKWWPVEQDRYLVFGRGMDGKLYEVRGESLDAREGVKRMILEESYGVSDWEVTLWHDANPYPQPLALGRWNDMALSLVREEPTIERLEGWEPIYWEGDYWECYTLEGLSILRYYSTMAEKNNYGINNIELTRDDFSTPRGVKLGSTRDEVTTAYPELKSGDYWGKYPGEDYLWYCEDELDFGPALIFFFENDKVSKIVMNNMFN